MPATALTGTASENVTLIQKRAARTSCPLGHSALRDARTEARLGGSAPARENLEWSGNRDDEAPPLASAQVKSSGCSRQQFCAQDKIEKAPATYLSHGYAMSHRYFRA